MMKKAFLTVAVIMVLPHSASAALSGFFDRAEQVQTIIRSTQVSSALHELPFDTIEFVGSRDNGIIEWRVRSRTCSVTVALKSASPRALGKTTYEIASISDCGKS